LALLLGLRCADSNLCAAKEQAASTRNATLYKPILIFIGNGNESHILSASFIKNVPTKARLIVTLKYFLPCFLMEKSDTTTANIEITRPITEIAPGTMLITVANNTSTIAAQPVIMLTFSGS
jgi:hypothetical protein